MPPPATSKAVFARRRAQECLTSPPCRRRIRTVALHRTALDRRNIILSVREEATASRLLIAFSSEEAGEAHSQG